MAEFPSLPVFTDAYIADTCDLTLEQHGVYLLLLILTWRRPDCALPNDMAWLRRALAGYAADVHGNRFNRVVPPLLARFFTLESDGKFHQKRLEKEREFLRKSSRKGKENANKRWHEERDINDLPDASGMLPSNAPTPTPTPTQILLPTAQQSDPIHAAREENSFTVVYDGIVALFPGLAIKSTAPIHQWLNAGCPPDLILAEVRRFAGRNVSSFGYFTSAVMDAKATRDSPARPGTPRPGHRPPPVKSNVQVL